MQAFPHVAPAILTGLRVAALLWLRAEPDWRRGGLAILRFAGCPLAIRLPPGSGLGEDAVLELNGFPA